jgi:cell division protein FtsN/Zn ribbon nucleic-acid-binding protein
MSITCPKCQFKGLIDTAPEAFETHVTCVRCGATFDAQPVEVQASLPPAVRENLPEPAFAPDSVAYTDSVAYMDEHDYASQDVLALPETHEADYREQISVPEDVLQVLHVYDAEPVAQEAVFANHDEEIADKPAFVMEEIEYQPSGARQAAGALQVVGEQGFKFGQTEREAPPEPDAQNAGMRLMRISPLWLLVCGMTFISVIILSNQFAKPAEQETRVAANFTPPSNKATNQAIPQPPAPAMNGQAVSQMTAAQAPIESKDETKAVEEKPEVKAVDEAKPAVAVSVAPATEIKSEPVVAAPQPEQGKTGGFTIQIGSYNVIEEANERVARLQSGGFDVRVVSVELPKRGTWYRVQSGRFGNREEAARYGQLLKSKGATDSFIITETQGGK